MKLKPKNTVQNPKALVYKRFTQLQDSYSKNVVYHTDDNKYWVFIGNNATFKRLEISGIGNSQIIEVTTRGTILEYNNKQFLYNNGWVNVTSTGSNIITLNNQPVFHEPVSNTYWVIRQDFDGITTKQVSQSFASNKNIVTIARFPAVYTLTSWSDYTNYKYYCVSFLPVTDGITTFEKFNVSVYYVDLQQNLFSVKTSDNKYWNYNNVSMTMVETQTPQVQVKEVNDYDICFAGNYVSRPNNASCPLMYYAEGQWNYSFSNSYSANSELFNAPFDEMTITYSNIMQYYSYNGTYWFYDNSKSNNQMEVIDFTYWDLIGSNIIPLDENNVYVGDTHTYTLQDGSFIVNDGVVLPDSEFLSAKFGNIARYQTNKYYFVGSFDYMIRGPIEGVTTQYIKGNIMPLTSINIKYFSDDISLEVDDLVVIEDKLFAIENPVTTQKRMPKAFNIHFATLNSIL